MGVWNEKRCNQFINLSNGKYYSCEKCRYKTTIKQCYNTHLLSERHNFKINSTDDFFEQNCKICNKIILSRTSLWRHAKNCKFIPEHTWTTNISNKFITDL